MDREERFQVIEPELKTVETFIGKHARSDMAAGAER
jgi:threonine synthase